MIMCQNQMKSNTQTDTHAHTHTHTHNNNNIFVGTSDSKTAGSMEPVAKLPIKTSRWRQETAKFHEMSSIHFFIAFIVLAFMASTHFFMAFIVLAFMVFQHCWAEAGAAAAFMAFPNRKPQPLQPHRKPPPARCSHSNTHTHTHTHTQTKIAMECWTKNAHNSKLCWLQKKNLSPTTISPQPQKLTSLCLKSTTLRHSLCKTLTKFPSYQITTCGSYLNQN